MVITRFVEREAKDAPLTTALCYFSTPANESGTFAPKCSSAHDLQYQMPQGRSTAPAASLRRGSAVFSARVAIVRAVLFCRTVGILSRTIFGPCSLCAIHARKAALHPGGERGRVELQPPRTRSALERRAENHEFETARRFRSVRNYELSIYSVVRDDAGILNCYCIRTLYCGIRP